MVEFSKTIGNSTRISSKENNSSVTEQCISDILSCFVKHGITVEVAYAILAECKKRIEIKVGESTFSC